MKKMPENLCLWIAILLQKKENIEALTTIVLSHYNLTIIKYSQEHL